MAYVDSVKEEGPATKGPAGQETRGAVMGKIKTYERGLFVLRLVAGLTFFWAGVEKLFNFAGDKGGFSAAGFLQFGTLGSVPGSAAKAVINPMHDFWVGIGTNGQLVPVLNFLVVFGELAIGAALLLGLATRFASIMGVLMVGFFYIAQWNFSLGLLNSQMVDIIITAIVGYTAAGEIWGLDAIVEKTAVVRRAPALRYVLG
jgi:thiosulfate dehydrogenase [quinone] large subunit